MQTESWQIDCMQKRGVKVIPKRTCKRTGGFTFIELMVAVVIVGVLAAVAFIAYGRWIKRGRITEGKTFVSTIMSRQEAYYQQYGQYCDAGRSGSHPVLVSGSEPVAKKWAPGSSSGWVDLAIKPPKGYTFFSFDVRASDPAAKHALFGEASGAPNMHRSPQPTAAGSTVHPWYYVSALADLDGDGGTCTGSTPSCTDVRASSARAMYVLNEGE